MGKRDRSGLLYLQRDGDVGLPFMGLGCYAYLGPFTGKIEIQVRRLIALGDAIDEIFQLGVLIIVLGDEGQGGVARINIYFVVELIFSNAAFQFGVQIGIGKLVFGDTLRLIVICQTCGGGVFSDGPHYLGFGLGLRAGRAAATAAGGQEQKGSAPARSRAVSFLSFVMWVASDRFCFGESSCFFS